MMGYQSGQKELFSYSVNLDERVPPGHPLRKVRDVVDFGFVRERTAQFYGRNGNESVDPAVVMKLMFLLFFDNVSSERELMRILPYRLDYLWFLDFGLDDQVPDHSVLSKARRRWGPSVFEELFAHTVALCMEAGLVEGSKLHMDSSLVQANAAPGAFVTSSPELISQLRASLGDELSKLEEALETSHQTPLNARRMSSTDPDCEWAGKRQERGRFRYKTHRAVDDNFGVITAVETTPGATADDKRLIPLVEQHEQRTGIKVKTVVADAQYGTQNNMAHCYKHGIRSHMLHIDLTSNLPHLKGKFSIKEFTYNEQADTFICPAGKELRFCQQRGHVRTYRGKKSDCNTCILKPQCTTTKQGRTVQRHCSYKQIEVAKEQSKSWLARRDRNRRKWLMEGSFADATNNHGFKKSRWRRLWRQRIQDLMIAAVQNLRKLLRASKWSPTKAESTLHSLRKTLNCIPELIPAL